MSKITVLVNKEKRDTVFSEKYYERLRKFGGLNIFDRDDFSDMDYVIDFVKGTQVLITSWSSPVLDETILDVCPDLKAVIHAAGSIKPILSDAFIDRKIRITNSAVALGEGVAETALGFAISACKGFYTLGKDTRNKLWNENRMSRVTDFYDITIGVIGGGYVGRHFIKLLQNFNVDILLYDPTLSGEQVRELGAEKAELAELLKRSDVVSVHAPSIPATDNMLNRENLKLIKDGAVLINTARGSVIDETALIEELEKNRFFACIDVTNPEPPEEENRLRFLDNVVLTPHIAGAVTNGLKRVAKHVCEELERLENGEKMRTEEDLAQLDKLA